MDTPGTCLRICTLDFSKAFDRIDFNILLQKLINIGIHPVLINWIANFLTDRRQRTRIGPNYSCWRPINGGVPQGTKLGPLLFLIMVKVSVDSVKFVDDTTLWEIITSAQSSTSVLQAQISECSSWVAKNNMKLKPAKTKVIRVCFLTNVTEALPPLTIDGCIISVVSYAKLLRLIISEDLKRVLHTDFICKKAAKRLHALRLLKRFSIPSSKLVRVLNTCIQPVLEYACHVWHHSLPKYLSDQIERIQRRALRIIFPDCFMILQWHTLVCCHYSYGERRSVRDVLNECAPTNHTNYIPLSLLIEIQNIPFEVVMTYFQYLGVELIDTQPVS